MPDIGVQVGMMGSRLLEHVSIRGGLRGIGTPKRTYKVFEKP